MSKTIVRLCVLALLMISTSVRGSVKVEFGTFTGGSVVEKSQSEPAMDGSVVVTITVTPAEGYEISKTDIVVMATVPSAGSRQRRAPYIAEPLTLQGDDPDDLSRQRDYTFLVEEGFGALVQTATFHRKASAIEAGTYRIYINGAVKWYLWPAVSCDEAGHPYLTTFNDIQAPALDYPLKGVSYEAFGEQYSLWQVKPVEAEGKTYYQLFNVGLQQYVVWQSASGLKAVHMEAEPTDEHHTLFRFDGTFPNCLITPCDAAPGTTLNSKFGDKPFLSSSGAVNEATGYPNGEPDPDGEGGLMQIYDADPVWTLERTDEFATAKFATISDDSEEAAALFVPPYDAQLAEGVTAYTVTGVDVMAGLVLTEEVNYLPKDVPLLLIAESDIPGFTLKPKGDDMPAISDEVLSSNCLRIGSPEVQPTAFEDYILYRGKFVLSGGGVLATGKVFLDLSPEQSAAARSVISIGGKSGTTAIKTLVSPPASSSSVWYTLDGRRLSTKPTQKGVYIQNGQKVIVK